MAFEPTEQNRVDLTRSILDLKKKKGKLVTKKLRKQGKVSETKEILNNPNLEKLDYDKATEKRVKFKKDLEEIDLLIVEVNTEVTTKRKLLESIESHLNENKSKRDSDDKILKSLTEMKDRYTQFSADHTRVASMRTMAAEFARELEGLINDLQ